MTNFSFNFDGWDEVVAFARQVVGEERAATQPQEVHITQVLPQQAAPVPQPIPAQIPQTAQPMPMPVPVPEAAPVMQPAPAPTAPAQQAPISAPTPTAAPQAAIPQPQQVPTTTAAYTLDDLARAAMPLMDAGRQADLQQLLKLFGVEALPALQPGQYGAFATKLREMGAQI